MLNRNLIRKKVLAIINKKIAEKQKEFEGVIKLIDNDCVKDIQLTKKLARLDRNEALESAVQSIIGKII